MNATCTPPRDGFIDIPKLQLQSGIFRIRNPIFLFDPPRYRIQAIVRLLPGDSRF